MNEISGLVITLNESRNIVDCLRSMKQICDDIVVVDSGSSLQKRRAQLSLFKNHFLAMDRNVLMACRIADISGY